MPGSQEFKARYDALNAEQKKAVDTLDGPVMVLAGPGTGKTQTLAMRIANILQKTQMDPWNILCLTFTESGVAAMRKRLLSIVGTPAYYVRIHTFHSFCNEILQDHPEIFAKGSSWKLVSDAEKVEFFQKIVDALPEGSPLKPFYAPYLFFRDIMQRIGELKQENISPKEFQDILRALEKFFKDISDGADTFFTLSPKERTHGACEQFRMDVRVAFERAGVKSSISHAVDHLFREYEAEYTAHDTVRDQSKARTKLKNAVKTWLSSESKNLERNRALALVYERYEEALGNHGMYDFEDMISRCVAEFRINDALLAEYQEQFQYILVDEYQDTNGGQNAVVELLGSFDDSPNIFVVGDDKQSIYRFQGASLANMLSFYERYKDSVQVISLRHNYRSQKTIIDAASSVISHNSESLRAHIPAIIETLIPGKSLPEQPIRVMTAESEDQEAYYIGESILQHVQAGVPPEDIAVLYRYNRDGQDLLHTLRALNIPARIEMGENIFASHEVRQWIVFLRWIVGDAQEDAIVKILQYEWWNIEIVDALKAIHYAGAKYIPLFTVLSSKDHLMQAQVNDASAMISLATRLAQFQREAHTMPVMEFLQHVMDSVGWVQTVLAQKDALVQLRAMKRLLNEAKELEIAHPMHTISDFVRHLSFLENHDIALLTPQWEGGVGAVHLLSAHKAKGLEWPHVYVMRMNDKHWGNPKQRSGISLPEGLVRYDFVFLNDHNEDERRLFYVALTRAMHTVTLTRASHSATGKETVPSIFLSEISPDHLASEEVVETPKMQEARLIHTLVRGEAALITEDAQAYVRSLLASYVMSVTHLNNYLECPRKFYWRNILQIPSMKSRSLMLGSAVHDTLRDISELIKTGTSVPIDTEVQKIFEKNLRKISMSEKDFHEILSRGTRAVTGYVNYYKNDFHTAVITEHDFKKYRVTLGDVPITGKLDKIEILDEAKKTINVVDYKTGNADQWYSKLKRDGNYVRQMIFYKLLCDNAPQFGYTIQSGEIDFVEPSKKGYVKKKVEITKEDTEALRETIQRVWKEIQDLKFMDPVNGCKKPDCEYCGELR